MSGPAPSDDLRLLLDSLPDMDPEAYLSSIASPLPECFRINTLKLPERSILALLEEGGWLFERLPWTRHGYRLAGGYEGQLGSSLEHMAGLIYLQGPLSMLPAEQLDVSPGQAVLDLCASPGSKSTQIAQLMENRGALVCNDVSSARVKPLVSNLQRFGVMNCVVTLNDGARFHRWARGLFDRVLVDAPCSSLGIASKDWGAARRYAERASERISRLQVALALSAYDCLREGGVMVYSTCTIHPLENEGVITELLERRPGARLLSIRPTGLRSRPPLEEWRGLRFSPEVRNCFKAYPQDNAAEGFFVAKVVKRSGDEAAP